MPRTALVPTALSRTAKVVQPAGTTIDAALVTNGVVIAPEFPMEELVVQVVNTFAGAKIVTIQSGSNPPALSAGQGDMTGSLVQNEVANFGPFESARFRQAGAEPGLHVDFEAGTTGFVRAYRVPRA